VPSRVQDLHASPRLRPVRNPRTSHHPDRACNLLLNHPCRPVYNLRASPAIDQVSSLALSRARNLADGHRGSHPSNQARNRRDSQVVSPQYVLRLSHQDGHHRNQLVNRPRCLPCSQAVSRPRIHQTSLAVNPAGSRLLFRLLCPVLSLQLCRLRSPQFSLPLPHLHSPRRSRRRVRPSHQLVSGPRW